MKRLLPAFAVAAILAGAALVPTSAEAKGIAIINTGEDVFEAGPVPELADATDPQVQRMRAGFKCSVFGVFWAYVHWWGCEPVLFFKDSSDSFTYDNSEVAKAMVTAHYKQSDMKIGFWAGNGRWIFLGALVLFVGGPILLGLASGRGGGTQSPGFDDSASGDDDEPRPGGSNNPFAS